MLYFHCKFLLDNGKKTDAIVPADDHISLLEAIEKRDGVLLRTTRLSSRVFKLSVRDAIFFFTYLREFISAGISLAEALETIAEETRKLNIKAVAEKLKNDIHAGHLLSDAMRNQLGVFSDVSISLVVVSEKMNQVASACDHIVHYLQFGDDLKRKIKSVIMYPIFMISMIFGMTVFYSKFVIPKLQAVFNEFSAASEMPLQTKLLVGFSSFISNYWLHIFAFSIALPFVLVSLYKTSPTFRYKMDSALLGVPFVSSVIIHSQLARFCLFTANIYEKGYNFLDSITEATIVITNTKMRGDIENMVDSIKSGESFYHSLRNIPYVPRFTHRMFRVAELTANVSHPLRAVHDFYIKEIDNDLEKILRLVKPVAILMIGALMIWIVSATLLPFYSKIPHLLEGMA